MCIEKCTVDVGGDTLILKKSENGSGQPSAALVEQSVLVPGFKNPSSRGEGSNAAKGRGREISNGASERITRWPSVEKERESKRKRRGRRFRAHTFRFRSFHADVDAVQARFFSKQDPSADWTIRLHDLVVADSS